jgi:hypothetical protein
MERENAIQPSCSIKEDLDTENDRVAEFRSLGS